MSLHEYQISKEISALDFPFYALIFAAMRQADTNNLEKLKKAFPAQWDELISRYKSHAGRLSHDGEHGLIVMEDCYDCDGCGWLVDSVTPGARCASCRGTGIKPQQKP